MAEVAGFQAESVTDHFRQQKRETSPAGNATNRPPSPSTRTDLRRLDEFDSAADLLLNTATGINTSRSSGIAVRSWFARILKSLRNAERRAIRTAPSSRPEGWLTTNRTAPVRGIRSSSRCETRISMLRFWSNRLTIERSVHTCLS